MSRLNVVGIVGPAGAGKDTAASYLVRTHGFTSIALADPIKRLLQSLFCFSDEALWGDSHKRVESVSGDLEAFWDASEQRLVTTAHSHLADILQLPIDASEVTSAYDSLVHYFFLAKKEHFKITPRIALQFFGTEYGRSIKDDLWINYAISVARKLLKEAGDVRDYAYNRRSGLLLLDHASHSLSPSVAGVVFSDLRFVNEIYRVKESGGSLLRIIRPGATNNAIELGIKGHVSETQQYLVDDSEYNATVTNDGSLSELYSDLDVIIACLVQ